MDAVAALAPGSDLITAACAALGLSRASLHRRQALRRQPLAAVRPQPTPMRALVANERQVVLELLREPRFVDLAPAEVYASLLDQGVYLCSIRGPRLSRDQRAAIECTAESGGDPSGFATCAGNRMLNSQLNPEQQIAVRCVVEAGGQPYAAAVCTASRLTLRELQKCVTDGIADTAVSATLMIWWGEVDGRQERLATS